MAPNLRFSFLPKSEPDVQLEGRVSDELVDDEWTNLKLHLNTRTDMPRSWLQNPATSPLTSNTKMKGRDRAFSNADSGALRLGHGYAHNADNAGSKCSDSSPSTATHDPSSPSTSQHSHFQPYSSSSLSSKHRTSFLSAASDVFGLRKKFGSVSRKKPNLHSLPHSSNIMPGVIEINAHNDTTVTGTNAHADCEREERERLRDVAAQSIGLGPELLSHPSKSASHSSLDSQCPKQPARLPPFPTTLVALRPFADLSATLPKFVPPSSLLVYALAKQWKMRTIILTTHPLSQKTHVHLFKSASNDEKEVERIEVTEDSVIFVAEEEVAGRGHVIKLAGKDVSTKRAWSMGEESLRIMWYLQIADPAESQRWIAAIKNAVLTQRAVRAGLDTSARMGGGNEPKGDMDVMLSMRLQGIIPTHSPKPFNAISSSPPTRSSPSPPPSLRSLRISIPSSSSPTAVKGILGTRPRSPSVEGSPGLPHPSGHAEDSFSAAGTNLLTMLRTKASAESSSSPSQSLHLPLSHAPGRGSPAPSLRSNHAPVVITASDLKISRERDAPESLIVVPEASSSGTHTGSNTSPTPSVSWLDKSTLSLQPPPRKSKHATPAVPALLLHEPREMYQQAGGNRSVAGNFGIPSGDSGDLTPRGASPASPDSSGFSGGQLESFSPNSGSEAPSPCVAEAHDNERGDEMSSILGNQIVQSSSPATESPSTDKLVQTPPITRRWSRQGVPLPKQLTPPSGPPPSIPSLREKNHRSLVESSISLSVTYTADRSSTSSSSDSHSQVRISPGSGCSLSPAFWKRASTSSTYSAISTHTSDSRSWCQRPAPIRGESFPSSFGLVSGQGASSRPVSMSVVGSSPATLIGTTKRRSMPPPRPAPNFAPPPAPTNQESESRPASPKMSAPASRKSFRTSMTQRALRLSLTSPKPPPSSALPPRPDEAVFVQGHRRSSSGGSQDPQPIPTSPHRPTSTHSGNSHPVGPASPPPRSLSLRQRLRILSTPSTSISSLEPPSSLIPPIHVSTLDLSDDNDDDLPTPYFQSPHPFGLGEHIITLQNNPSFLHLETPATPTFPKHPSRDSYRATSPMSGLKIASFGSDGDFVSLSPPPPRKPHIGTGTRPEKVEVEQLGLTEQEESELVALSQRGSVVSLGFVTT